MSLISNCYKAMGLWTLSFLVTLSRSCGQCIQCLSGDIYTKFLENEMPALLEDSSFLHTHTHTPSDILTNCKFILNFVLWDLLGLQLHLPAFFNICDESLIIKCCGINSRLHSFVCCYFQYCHSYRVRLFISHYLCIPWSHMIEWRYSCKS